MKMPMTPRLRLVFAATALLAGTLLLPGCYEHVVRAEGFGSESVDTYEPNLPDKQTPLDDAIFGPNPKSKSWRNNSKSWRDR